MKRKFGILEKFIVAFIVFGILLLSPNFASAQCGNYLKTNYTAINKLDNSMLSVDLLDDWTGDGRSDIWNFRRNPATSRLDVVIYPSQPTGYWDWDNPIIYTTTILNYGNDKLTVADADADGRKDLIFGVQIHRNTGNGSLAPAPAMTDSDGSVQLIGLAYVNGDNLLDMIYVVFVGPLPGPGAPEYEVRIRYQTQNPDGSFSNKNTIIAGTAQNGLNYSNRMLGDFNGDGKTDILYSTFNVGNTNKYSLIKNLGGGNFEVGALVAGELYAGGKPSDFNNDGRGDILSRAIIFYGQADGSFNPVPLSGQFGGIPAELNGDNHLDLIEIDESYYATRINDGAGNFTRTVYPHWFGRTGFGAVMEDFSGDGKADFYNTGYLQNSIYNIFGERLLSVKENVCQPAGETQQADFDANATADVAMWNPGSGNWSSKNAGWQSPIDPNTRVFNWGLGSLGDVPAPGDFDGDGKTDYSVYRSSTGVWYVYQSSNSSWLTVQFGLPGDVPVPNDYDGGGKTDIAVFRPSDGNWYFWFMETQTFGAVHFGTTGDKPVPADYDGDNKIDVAVYRPSEGNWYYMKSSDYTHVVLHWGNETDKPLPADYDGDGRADLAIYRDGFWWIWRSSNNSYAVAQWGQPGDVPMPVYRNGVSADLILYRPSHNSWHSYVFRASGGFTLGGNGDVPVYFGLPNN